MSDICWDPVMRSSASHRHSEMFSVPNILRLPPGPREERKDQMGKLNQTLKWGTLQAFKPPECALIVPCVAMTPVCVCGSVGVCEWSAKLSICPFFCFLCLYLFFHFYFIHIFFFIHTSQGYVPKTFMFVPDWANGLFRRSCLFICSWVTCHVIWE